MTDSKEELKKKLKDFELQYKYVKNVVKEISKKFKNWNNSIQNNSL